MLTSPESKKVLFYGDSLVFGKVPALNQRWPAHIRFTGVLQDVLGKEYDIIEEGLRGRTLFGENGYFPERNGLEQFGPIIGSHLPIDLLVVMLGTNDANNRNSLSPQESATVLSAYKSKLDEWALFLGVGNPRMLILGPLDINEDNYDSGMKEVFGTGASSKLKELRREIERTALVLSLDYIDISAHCSASIDGIHLDEAGNRQLATLLSEKIRGILQT